MRPRKCRIVHASPSVRFYKPRGVPLRALKVVTLKDEEWQAIALADYRHLDQAEAAEQMGISRPTFSRVLASARKAVATALAEGAALKIDGGDFRRVAAPADACSGVTRKIREECSMKIAVSTGGEDLSAPVDPRFGRAARFLILDLESGAFSLTENTATAAAHGAGLQAAQTVAAAGVRAVITGSCGPKALDVLVKAGIRAYAGSGMTVGEAVEKFRAGELSEIPSL